MTGVGDNEAATASVQPGSSNSQTPYLGPHSHSHGYTADCSQQNRLLWNLFSQGLDRLLINLLACSQKVNIDHLRQIDCCQGLFFKRTKDPIFFTSLALAFKRKIDMAHFDSLLKKKSQAKEMV
jgi:hypothetical protein